MKSRWTKNGLLVKLAACLSITVALFVFEVGSSGKQLFVCAFSVFTGAAGCIHSRASIVRPSTSDFLPDATVAQFKY